MGSEEMNNGQGELFSVHITGVERDHAMARFTDPVTSHKGDAKMRRREGTATEVGKNTHRHRALACFEDGPKLPDEVCWRTGIDGVWKRVSELIDLGLIVRTGRERKTRADCDAKEYEITDAGRGVLEKLR